MKGASFSPEKALQITLDQLRLDMPKSSFDTWVQDASFISFEEGIFTVGTPNEYGREWLASRLTSTFTRLLIGILNQKVEVRFIVVEETSEDGIEKPHEDENSAPMEDPAVLSLQAEYQSIYDEIVQPHQVIVVPGYFLRFISVLGLDLAWLYIGFRQAAYEAGAAKQPGKMFGAPAKNVARYSGMSLRTFRRYSANPDTWQRLRDLVTPAEDKPQWQYGNDNHPHRTPRYYRVAMTLPLTPADELSLRAWLYKSLAEGKNPLAALQDALEIPVDELIPRHENTPSYRDGSIELHSVQDVLHAVCGPISENDRSHIQELADQLAQHLMPPRDLVFLTHYFVTRWLPKLGHGQGWFVVLIRDRCYLNPRTGEIRDEALVDQGYSEIADWLGLKRVKTIWEWLRIDDVARFVREIRHEIDDWEESPRRFKVCLGEPMTEEDRIRANGMLAKRGFGANDTIRDKRTDSVIGAVDTHKGESDTISSETINAPVGAVSTYIGAIDTPVGANGTSLGGNDTHKNGAAVTFDWREWHSLNTLALGLTPKKNTPTTAGDGIKSDLADPFARHEKGVVGAEWNLSELLSRNRVGVKNQEMLMENSLNAQSFVSWLLYSASLAGVGIRDPIAHAVSRLIPDPTHGAGGALDKLAKLPASELADMLTRELAGQSPWDQAWRKAMEGGPRDRLRTLADQLGIPVPDTGY
ncbi:MAG: hypothetical protein FIA98_16130 [Anaerolineae bacterium]|nr:hypothetical protein [Anaerolineae bacterium]